MKKIKLIAALLSVLFLTGCVDQSGNQSAEIIQKKANCGDFGGDL